MRITILFGGTNKERLVSVASAQALHLALPEADLWFWDVADTVHEVRSQDLLGHARPFEDAFKPGSRGVGLERRWMRPRPRIVCWCSACTAAGRRMANCRRCAKCAAFPSPGPARPRRILPSTRWRRSALRRIAGVKAPAGIALEDIEAALAEYGKLIAKPARDGSSYGLIFVNAKQDLVAVRNAARTEEYLIEPFISGVEATCGVLEQSDGSVFSLPPIEIVPAEGGFDYTAKYLLKSTQEICPGRFSPEITAQIMDQALRAHRALSCSGYSRTDFIVSAKGPIYLETNTLPGLTKASLYPKALKAQGIEFPDFLQDQILLAAKRVPASRAGHGRRPLGASGSIAKILTIMAQSTEKADQNTSSPRRFYPLFTRKSEG